MKQTLFTLCLMLAACGPDEATTGPGGTGGSHSGTGGGSSGTGGSGAGGGTSSSGGGAAATGGGSGQGTGGGSNMNVEYPVYAHSDHTLYSITLSTKQLVLVGSFGTTDVITDLAVAPSGTIYVVSHTTLYTADPNDGHVTMVGPLTDCGQDNVALSFLPDGRLFVADYKGQFCQINYSASPISVTPIAKLSGTMAVSGDLVAVKDGTLYASAYDLNVSSTQNNNVLVRSTPTLRA
jgi:hypothetical protein